MAVRAARRAAAAVGRRARRRPAARGDRVGSVGGAGRRRRRRRSSASAPSTSTSTPCASASAPGSRTSRSTRSTGPAGIGKQLLDAAKDWARSRGATHLELDSGRGARGRAPVLRARAAELSLDLLRLGAVAAEDRGRRAPAARGAAPLLPRCSGPQPPRVARRVRAGPRRRHADLSNEASSRASNYLNARGPRRPARVPLRARRASTRVAPGPLALMLPALGASVWLSAVFEQRSGVRRGSRP